ncbi:hypothetical protein [Micromonospora aurantiaca (nom. illeg.)]|uniref:hypothetical protein n=1 Tax=Micromonospora aurantiaca (nom. illeg.) TaxID=47850 RepID=UPI00340BFC42
MAVSAAQVVVSSTATALNTDTGPVSGGRLIVKNTHATDALVLGDASVAAGTGFALAAGLTLEIRLSAGEQVYAIRGGSADITAHVLRVGG